MVAVSFAPWRPDVAHLNSAFAEDVVNVLKTADGYIPFPALAAFSEAVGEQPLGGITIRSADGSVHIFVGGETTLYKLNTSTLAWDDVSQAATTYAASTDERWRFIEFGDYVVAVNINDAPQVYEIGVSSEFADLGGSPPNANGGAVWGDHLALWADNTVYWSDTDNIANWSTGNSGSQTFPDGSVVQGSSHSTNPIVIQKDAIRFGTFMPGSLEVFSFHKIHDKTGAMSRYSVCSRGHYTFFAGSGAFYQITPDGVITPIGFEKVDRTVFGQIGGAELYTIYGEVDPFFPRVYFAVRVDSTSSAFDKLLCYDWQIGEWTQIDTQMDILLPLASGTIGYTLEGLDAISSSIDDLPFSLDSKVWQGGAPVMAAFDTDNKLGFFSGGNAEAILTTQEFGDAGGQVQRVTECYPIVDADDLSHVNVSIGARMRRSDTFVWTEEFRPSSNTGIARKRSRARFQKFKLRITEGATWSAAQGINVNATPAGMR